MLFQIVSPVVATIDGDSVKDAVKNFIKLNYQLNLAELIIKDQNMHMNARIDYYKQDGRNKVGINMFPVGFNYPVPIVTNDTYVPPRYTDSIIASVLPMSPVSPMAIAPFMPTVINIPNV